MRRTVFVCLVSERARAAPPLVGRSVGCMWPQPGGSALHAGRVGQMHGKYWTTRSPLAKISPLAQESGCTAREFLSTVRREGETMVPPRTSLSFPNALQSNFSFLPLITTEEEEEEERKCRGYFQKDALCGPICLVFSRGRRYLGSPVHVVRNCHLVIMNRASS